MPLVFWDASGLVKRYGPEPGSETVDAIFNAVTRAQMFTTLWGYAECYAVLHRKRNQGRLDSPAYAEAVTALQQEVLSARGFNLLAVEDERLLAGLTLIVRHNLNSADAAILATFLRYVQSLPPGSPPGVLVTADVRLLRAARAEGLNALNPELLSPADVAPALAGIV